MHREGEHRRDTGVRGSPSHEATSTKNWAYLFIHRNYVTDQGVQSTS